ncbi:MAG: aspartate/glutamate racemase family protein [Pseudomonadota bacterium]
MHLGLIGGTGPAATLKYYAGLCAAMAEHDKALRATIAHMDIKESRRLAEAGDTATAAQNLSERIADLKAAGAEVAVLTAISGHAILDQVQALSPLPIASVLPALSAYVAREGLGRVGIIGSGVAMDTRAMGAFDAIETVIPENPALRAEVSRSYFEMAVARHCTKAQRDLFFDAGRHLVDEHGAEAVLLGGTDLCLAFDGHNPGYRTIDAIDVHVADLATKSLK